MTIRTVESSELNGTVARSIDDHPAFYRKKLEEIGL